MIWLVLTLVVFYSCRFLAQRVKHPLSNPLLFSLLVLIPTLLLLEVPYETYFEGNQAIHLMLQPAVVALAYPLYAQLPAIKAQWRLLLSACLVGSLLAMLSGAGAALLLGAELELVAAVLPKSVTTPIAMSVTEGLGGETTISALMVLVAGLFGALFGYPILRMMGISSPIARGLAIGSVSHALGTARAVEEHHQDAAMSSMALVLCGVITSLLAPLVFMVFS
ncbi:CidB/LrgB family autolysis modulator [Thaumasiovibrio subtropicus]|uniref:CidB/LrgB family autolysis modulator n=1 Tax=Thaumasiovibrio subtropicus TaxID=1891207 RepID=UPI000B35659E|nr:CidB/LrgB family autolysis modulator [Thaumasiovibrio subtropicus]